MSLTLPRGQQSPIVWSIAGSDCAAAAGLQTDLKTLSALGAHGCTIVTSITAQNTSAVQAFEAVSPKILKAQIDALLQDLPPQVIKIGMLGDAPGVRVLAATLNKVKTYTIYDPVLKSSSGTQLLTSETLAAMLQTLLPLVDLLTPNLAETEALTGTKIRSDSDVEAAATQLLKTGIKSVLIKGWDSDNGYVQDYYSSAASSFWLTSRKHKGEVPRGTGCTMASAIAAANAFGFDAADAAVIAKAYVNRCLRTSRKLGKGPPVAEHRPWPVAAEDLPWLTSTAKAGRTSIVFPDCGEEILGFYPVVDSVEWLQRLLPLGVRTAQLRIKNLGGAELEKEIIAAIALAKRTNTRLFINDFWQLAIKHGAYGVHLGQEDLLNATLESIAAAGLRVGLSTHSYAELAAAKALQPSYIALGPIFPTTLKTMRFAPQGMETLHLWRKFVTCPLVAIGGIKLEQAREIYESDIDGIAVVSDITQNANPENRAKDWLKLSKVGVGFVREKKRVAALS